MNFLKSEENKAWIGSFINTFFFVFLTFWLSESAKVAFTSRTNSEKVIEIFLPTAEDPRQVYQKPFNLRKDTFEEERLTTTTPKTYPETQERPKETPKDILEKDSIFGREVPEEPTPVREAEGISQSFNYAKTNTMPTQETKVHSSSQQPPSQEQSSIEQEKKGNITNKNITQDSLLHYYAQIRNLIERHKRYPEEAKRRGQQGTVLVKIRISEQGTLDQVEIIRGSGYSLIDRETTRVLRAIGKFPPPPFGNPLEIYLEIEYKLGG